METIKLFGEMSYNTDTTYKFNGVEYIFLKVNSLGRILPFSADGAPVHRSLLNHFGRVHFRTQSYHCRPGECKNALLEQEKVMCAISCVLNDAREQGISLADARNFLQQGIAIEAELEEHVKGIFAHYDRIHNTIQEIFGDYAYEFLSEYVPDKYSTEERAIALQTALDNPEPEIAEFLQIPKTFLTFLSSLDGGEQFTIKDTLSLYREGKESITKRMDGTPSSVWGGSGLSRDGRMFASWWSTTGRGVSMEINESEFWKTFHELGYDELRYLFDELPTYARRRIWRKFIGK